MPAVDQSQKIFLRPSMEEVCFKYKQDGIEKKTGGWESTLTNVTMVFKPANLEHKIPAKYAYVFEFTWGEEVAVLELSEDHSFATSLLNAIAGIPMLTKGQQIYISPYKSKSSNNVNLFIAEAPGNSEWLAPKFPYDEATKSTPGVPRAVPTGQYKPDGKEIYDWSEPMKFWRGIWANEIHPALNGGKKGEFPRAKERVLSLLNRIAKMKADGAKDAEYAKAIEWAKANLYNQDDQVQVILACPENVRPAIGAKEEKKPVIDDADIPSGPPQQDEPQEVVDDLPF